MSNTLSTMLSLLFIFIAFMFGVDLVMMQYIYTDLDSFSIQASYLVSKKGYITSEMKDVFLSTYGVKIYPFESNNLNQSYEEGFVYGFVLVKEYSPIALSNKPIELKVKRYAVINVYN